MTTPLPPHLRLDRPAPACRQCGRPLTRSGFRYYSPVASDRGAFLAKGTVLNDYTGKRRELDQAAVVIKCKPANFPAPHRQADLTVWFGEHGPRNDGFFCSLRCGYQWAVMKLRTRGD